MLLKCKNKAAKDPLIEKSLDVQVRKKTLGYWAVWFIPSPREGCKAQNIRPDVWGKLCRYFCIIHKIKNGHGFIALEWKLFFFDN